MVTQTDIRREIRDQRRRLDPDWVRQISDLIQQRVLALDEWTSARRVCCYLAAPTEVQTDRILDACWQAGKRVWVPAFHPERERYECARLDRGGALTPGQHGIPEPETPAWGEPEAIDLVIVPGLAFDSHGGRIGHGGGHYDRLLAQKTLKRAFKVGLAFAFQVRNTVPVKAHDAVMDLVVMEDTVIRRRAEREDRTGF